MEIQARWQHLIVVLICCLIAEISHAYYISPIIMHLSPQGSSARQAVDVINDGDQPLAIEITLKERSIDANGKEQLVDLEDQQKLFAIYPPQLIVAPNATRTVQVQYIGDPTINKELAYKLIFEELNINFEKKHNKAEQGGIDFLIKYQASLYVTPEKAQPNVIIKSMLHNKDKKQILLTLENTGDAHHIINIPQIMRGNTMVLDEKSLFKLIGSNLLAKGIREYKIDIDKLELVEIDKNLKFRS